MIDFTTVPAPAAEARWAKVIDHTRCIGCHACSTACKSENEVPLAVNRTYVKYVDVGAFPQARRAFQVNRCNQCDAPPCVTACPTAAMFRRADGIVDFDKASCIGCKACIAACPYDAIFINPEDHSAEKCNFCAHRLDIGLEPACVVVCPTESIVVGDLGDERSRVSRLAKRGPVTVRRPEKETQPKLFYRGAHQYTLDPIAAVRPAGGMFMWSEQASGRQAVVSGHPAQPNNSAAAMLAYDVPHQAPWDWRVSLYTWTKGLAAGVYMVAACLVFLGSLSSSSVLWRWVAPIGSGAFLAATAALLIWDLEHPRRFYFIFTRSQWHSWLVRGGYIIGGYSTVLGAHFLGSLLDLPTLRNALIWPGVPLAVLTAIYTAYLFAQAKARDLWQSPLLVPHLLIHAVMAGAAVLALCAARFEPSIVHTLLWLVAASSILHLLFLAAEVTVGHSTAHARLAVHELVRGRYRWSFRTGVLLTALAALAPWVGLATVPPALLGLFLNEHAYVQAGQSVPLA